MTDSTPRVRARIIRSQNGQLHNEYIIDGIAYGSLEEARAVMEER